jgi:predicted metal-dependent phosphoesterase TrpH
MHTTASDGRHAPEELVERAWNVGIRTMSVTDHDTFAGCGAAAREAERRGMTMIPGIEITSIHAGRDVHVLAYFVSDATLGLQTLLIVQRQRRLDRALEISDRLARLGVAIDAEALVNAAIAPGGKSLARPQIAQALVTAGHVASIAEAFDKYLGEASPAYVPHFGASPAEVVELVSRSGGLASLAHPGYRQRDEIIPQLVEAGLSALEAYHSSHDSQMQAHYLRLARKYGVGVSGGSDYHGEGTRRAEFFGVTRLPQEHFDALLCAHRLRLGDASAAARAVRSNSAADA